MLAQVGLQGFVRGEGAPSKVVTGGASSGGDLKQLHMQGGFPGAWNPLVIHKDILCPRPLLPHLPLLILEVLEGWQILPEFGQEDLHRKILGRVFRVKSCLEYMTGGTLGGQVTLIQQLISVRVACVLPVVCLCFRDI